MSGYEERPLAIECGGETLVGIVAAPAAQPAGLGVLVVVGGPQYRVGSHRQFVLLSRALAARGIACLRFDYRGMGDAPGEQRTFETIDDDIRAAIDAFYGQVPGMNGVVLWGLCDGASAASFYAARDQRVAGLVLLNPWVRTAATAAKVQIEKYYLRRLLQPAFWKKLLVGGVAVGSSVRELFRAVRTAKSPGPARNDKRSDLPSRMAGGLRDTGAPLLLVLSGKDFVANEFEQTTAGNAAWSPILARAAVHRLDAADHTFSTEAWRDEVATATANWVASLDASRADA